MVFETNTNSRSNSGLSAASPSGDCVLTLNAGSSSLKVALFEIGESESIVLSAEAERIGLAGARLRVTDESGQSLLDRQLDLPDHQTALKELFELIKEHLDGLRLFAVGHRIVYGGSLYEEPSLVTPELLEGLSEMTSADPDHMPQAINAIHFTSEAYPRLPQVACFDTAFHRQMPTVSRMYALPRRFFDSGAVRHGFHGLSCEYIMEELRRLEGDRAAGRVVIAHLGNGSSMTAVREGKSLDTSMGFTPTAGLVMGTRSGDIDPGLLIYLIEEQKMSAGDVNRLINRESGLLGISGISEDMRDLIERESTDPEAAEAVSLFCYRAKKYLGAYAAALGGLDILVFTAGIGEHAATIRERICSGLEFLGIRIEPELNRSNAPVISSNKSVVEVRVMKTDEDRIVARHVVRLLGEGRARPPV